MNTREGGRDGEVSYGANREIAGQCACPTGREREGQTLR